MNPTTTAASTPRFQIRPEFISSKFLAPKTVVRSGEFMGQSSTTWLAVGAVVVVGAVVLMGKKRRRK